VQNYHHFINNPTKNPPTPHGHRLTLCFLEDVRVSQPSDIKFCTQTYSRSALAVRGSPPADEIRQKSHTHTHTHTHASVTSQLVCVCVSKKKQRIEKKMAKVCNVTLASTHTHTHTHTLKCISATERRSSRHLDTFFTPVYVYVCMGCVGVGGGRKW
jgi:hypothetical protein